MKNKLFTYLEALVLQQKPKAELINLILELQEREKNALEDYSKLYKRIREIEKKHKEDLSMYDKRAEKYIQLYAESDFDKENYKRVADLKLGKAYNLNANWIDKIVFVLKEAKRPLRSSEILDILTKNDISIRTMTNPKKSLSTHLNRAMKYGRIVGETLIGENGYLFRLPS